jgi:MinD superfamily P-loop ATPase
VIRAVKKRAAVLGAERWTPDIVILDCPPGTSCPMVATVRGADFALLVTEPTPFGLHDLILAVDTIRKMGLPFGVAINRCDVGDDRVVRYCEREGIPVLAQIPNDRRVAETYSSGGTLLDVSGDYRRLVAELRERIEACVAQGGRR